MPETPEVPDQSAQQPGVPDPAAPEQAQPQQPEQQPPAYQPQAMQPPVAPPAAVQPPTVQPPTVQAPTVQPPTIQPPTVQPPAYWQQQQPLAPELPYVAHGQPQQAQPEYTQPVQQGQPEYAQPVQQAQPEYAYAGQPGQAAYEQPGQPGQPVPPYTGQPGQPGQPFQPGQQLPPYPGQQPPKKGLPLGVIFGIIGGAILAIVLIVFTTMLVKSGTLGGIGSQSPEEQATSQVTTYLTALSEGDADTALTTLLSVQESDLLTEDVLKKSLELAPISNIVVDEESVVVAEDGYSATISASFDIGSETINREFTLRPSGDDIWTIGDGIEMFSISSFDGLEPMVNGATLTGDYAFVFPGAYEVTLGVDAFQVDSDKEFLIVATEDQAIETYSLRATLTEEATEEFRTLVRASLNECLAMTSLNTPCGMDITAPFITGEQAIDGTVARTLKTEGEATLAKLKPNVNYNVPTVVSASDSIAVSIDADVEKDGQQGRASVLFGAPLLTPTVDFAADEPKVVWE